MNELLSMEKQESSYKLKVNIEKKREMLKNLRIRCTVCGREEERKKESKWNNSEKKAVKI